MKQDQIIPNNYKEHFIEKHFFLGKTLDFTIHIGSRPTFLYFDSVSEVWTLQKIKMPAACDFSFWRIYIGLVYSICTSWKEVQEQPFRTFRGALALGSLSVNKGSDAATTFISLNGYQSKGRFPMLRFVTYVNVRSAQNT